ncbi:MAG: hypothetical protein EZS28_011941 [Streblomastix strix]|uniref:Uncharacterized protein n=1 Tax=Streblomastix strix TaxID=222440 RepID=A0A5J4WC67_9EUKA|nr:MAG: hypothetical protein EZS28_011941 [Streblomastix strix]
MSKGSEINLYTESTNREEVEESEGEVDQFIFKANGIQSKGFGYVYFKNSDDMNKVFKQNGYRVIRSIEYPDEGDHETVFVEYTKRTDAEQAKLKLEELAKLYQKPWRVMWVDASLLNCSVFITFNKHDANQEKSNGTFNENKIAEEFKQRFRKVRRVTLKIDNNGRYIDNGIVYFENNFSGEQAAILSCGKYYPNEILVGKVKVKVERRSDDLNENSSKSKERANKFRGTKHLELLSIFEQEQDRLREQKGDINPLNQFFISNSSPLKMNAQRFQPVQSSPQWIQNDQE